jgi:hypothetical protein
MERRRTEMGRTHSYSILGVAAAVLLATLIGCEDDSTTGPDCGKEQIVGRITAPALPVRANVIASRVRDPLDPLGSSIFEARVVTDSSGSYLLSVIPGRYIIQISVRGASGVSGWLRQGSLSRSEPDTLVVEEGGDPVRADLTLGALHLELDTPANIEGESMQATLRGDATEYLYIHADAQAIDGKAVFDFPFVPARTYTVGVHGFDWAFLLPGTYSEAEGEEITIQAGQETVHQAAFPAFATIHGSITGSWQQMDLGTPTVSVYTTDSTRVGEADTDQYGGYRFWLLAPLHVRLLISINYYHRWYGGNSFATATEFDLEPGEDVEANVVESGIAGELDTGERGYAYDSIRLCDSSGSVIAESGTSGRVNLFRFANLLPGTYFIHIPQGSTWIDHWYDHAGSFEQATPIEITREGQVVWIDPTLLNGANISGRLLDASGEPVLAALIYVSTAEDPSDDPNRRTFTGDGGEFDVIALADGAYKLGARTDSHGFIWYPSTAAWDSAAVITIANHESVTGIVIQYGP